MWLSESNATTDEWRIYKIDEKLSVSPSTHNEKGRFLSVLFFCEFLFRFALCVCFILFFFCKHQMEMGTHFARICWLPSVQLNEIYKKRKTQIELEGADGGNKSRCFSRVGWFNGSIWLLYAERKIGWFVNILWKNVQRNEVLFLRVARRYCVRLWVAGATNAKYWECRKSNFKSRSHQGAFLCYSRKWMLASHVYSKARIRLYIFESSYTNHTFQVYRALCTCARVQIIFLFCIGMKT